jgi:acyl-CoA synthetase (NDP forming)
LVSRSHLARLLAPRSIAVIGGREAAEVVRQCEAIRFAGSIWPVNPRRAEMAGRPTFASVADLPAAPDAAFIAVPGEATITTLEALAGLGAGGAVCYAAGFAEIGPPGAALQRRLVASAGPMAIAGPNCYGLINYLDGAALWPDQHGGRRVERGVAIVTQSGNIGLNLTMQRRGLPIAYLVTVGNKARGDFADYIQALLDDSRVSAIGLHIEGLDDIEGFAKAALRAREMRVPIVVVKTGRSETGAELALSHTSSLAGSDRLHQAFFERYGIARANDLSIFLETLSILHCEGPLSGRRLSSMSCSGGEASLIADLAESYRLVAPPLAPAPSQRLADVLGPKVAISNPLDYHTYIWGDFAGLRACFSAMLSAGYDINLLILDYPRDDRCDRTSWALTLEALVAAKRAHDVPVAVVASIQETLPEDVAGQLAEAGIIALHGLGDGLAAIALCAGIGEAWALPSPPPLAAAAASEPSLHMIGEKAAKDALAPFGLCIPQGRIVAIEKAATAAAELGFPVSIKTASPAHAHKTEIGGVKLNIANPAQADAAARSMAGLGGEVLVETMIEGAVAELIIGVTFDRQFGLALTIGAGGTLVDLIDDSCTLLLPSSRGAIETGLKSLKIARLLQGFRGRPQGDVEACLDAIVAIAAYALAHRERLRELDVNPLLVLAEGRGAVAVDALIRQTR